MTQVLFFDTDKDLKTFFRKNNCCEIEPIFFSNSINHTSVKDLQPYSESSIISIFTHSQIVDNSKLALFKNLKLVATRSTGVNHIDLDFCKQNNIQVPPDSFKLLI